MGYKKMSDVNQKSEDYIKTAQDTVSIIEKGVEDGEIFELSHKLANLEESAESKEKYIFEKAELKMTTKILLAGCIVLTIIGIGCLPFCIGTARYSTAYRVYGIIGSIIIAVLIGYNVLYWKKIREEDKYNKRYNKYFEYFRFKSITLIDDMAAYANIDSKLVIKDLKLAVKLKLIPQGHFGTDNIIFMVSDNVYKKYKEKQAVYDRYYRKQLDDRIRMNERSKELEDILEQGREYIAKIHASNDIIKDKVISQKLDRMEKVVEMIFHEVDINPKQADKLGMFMSYYLPTTEKLLESYINISEKQIQGRTLKKTKEEIEKVLDKIIESFETLLDKFYQEQELDITSDITTIEMLMKQEGLTRD